MKEDEILVRQFLDGNEQAFHRLIMKYYNAIYALILSWVKNQEDAKDLTQEVFLEAYLDLGSLRQPEQFYIWLKQIARHQYQDWLRKRKVYDQLDENMICETASIDETLILRETLVKVIKAIDELPKSESQILRDRYLNSLSYDELSTKHRLSYSVLAMRLSRARQHIREKVKSLSVVLALSWQDFAKKIFLGGIGTMKVGIKIKLIITGIAVVMVSGETGLWIWHYHWSTTELSEISTSQVSQNISQQSSAKAIETRNIKGAIVNKSVKQEKNYETDKAKTDEQENQIVKSPIGSNQVEQKEETLMEKYERITNSPEYRKKIVEAGKPFMENTIKYLQESEKLKYEETQLEEKLAKATAEEQDQIQKELADVQSKYRDAKINHFEYIIMTTDAFDKVALEYFTVDELDKIFRQKSAQVTTQQMVQASLERMREEEIEFVAEAKKRLQNKGFVPNQWTAKNISWLQNGN